MGNLNSIKNFENSEAAKSSFIKTFGEAVLDFFDAHGDVLVDVASKMIDVQKKLPQANYELSKYGWYVDFDFLPASSIKLTQKISEGRIDVVDRWFFSYFKPQKLDIIEQRLIKNYPNRKNIFKASFNHHRNFDYISSITLLLTQIDGIFNDKTGMKYFTKDKDLGIDRFNLTKYGITELLITPLKEFTSINASEKYIDNYPIRLNRHEILHGINTDFGTEINSLKIISLVNFMDEFLTQVTNE